MEFILTSLTDLLGDQGMFAVWIGLGCLLGGKQLRRQRKYGDSYDSGR